jgi:outer membrane lipoprotein SlyB
MFCNTRLKALLLFFCMLISAGCQSQYGAQQTAVHYYPQCYRPVQDLRADENTTAKATAGGAAAGVVGGALLGLLLTGKAEGALAGAVAGGAVGAVGGNAYGKNKAQEQDQQKLQGYLAQLGDETGAMNRASAAARVATKCYNTQFTAAAQDFKAGKISRADFEKRYAEIRSGLQETAFILRTKAENIGANDADFNQALAVETTAPVKSPEQKKARQQARSQVKQWQQSKQSMQQTSQEVDGTLARQEDMMHALLG